MATLHSFGFAVRKTRPCEDKPTTKDQKVASSWSKPLSLTPPSTRGQMTLNQFVTASSTYHSIDTTDSNDTVTCTIRRRIPWSAVWEDMVASFQDPLASTDDEEEEEEEEDNEDNDIDMETDMDHAMVCPQTNGRKRHHDNDTSMEVRPLKRSATSDLSSAFSHLMSFQTPLIRLKPPTRFEHIVDDYDTIVEDLRRPVRRPMTTHESDTWLSLIADEFCSFMD